MRALLVVAALLAAGCVELPSGSDAVSFEGALSPDRYGDVLAEAMPFIAPDGALIDAWVFRPDTSETGEKVPIIINYSPYWSNLAPPAAEGGDAFSLYLIDHFVPRGYAVALVSVRGTGLSDGCFSIGGTHEIDDADGIATYLAEQDWSNGNVAAVAKSYDGTVAQGLLTRANPHVRTIVPVSPISEFYKYNYFDAVTYTLQGDTFNALYVDAVSLRQSDDPRGATYERTTTRVCDESLAVQQAGVHSALTGDYTPYWQERNYTALLPDTLDASVFYIHGLQDWNVKPDHMMPWLEALAARNVTTKMWLGQWEHDYPHRGDWNTTLLRWFDSELKGIDTGIRAEPLVQVQDNNMVWRHEADWPPTRATRVALFPTSDGTLGAAAGSGTSSYVSGPAPPIGPAASEIAFRTTLEDDWQLAGAPTLEIAFTSTMPRATLSATLYADGEFVTQGFLDLAHTGGLDQIQPLTPGAPYTASVHFFPQDVPLPQGSELLLVIGWAPPDDTPVGVTPPPTQALVTLQHGDTTYLTLPIVPRDTLQTEEPQPDNVGCWTC